MNCIVEGHFYGQEGGVFIRNQIPVMNYPQYRRMRKLVHECCNYDNGNCVLLDDGEECVCDQSISYSLLCKWFRCAVLPLDEPLETALLFREELKRCVPAASHSSPVPTGQNTVSSVRQKFTADRKQPATGKGGYYADN